MPTILSDPNEAACPDFASEDYSTARNSLISDTIDEATALVMLTASWNANNAAEKVLWARQVELEAAAVADMARQVQEEQARRNKVFDQEEQVTRTEERKKNTEKYLPIPNRAPPTTPPEIVSTYATTRLRKGQYVELWYFTNDGLDYALQNSATLDEDAMVQTIDKDGRPTWVTTAASRESHAVKDDRHLDWEAFTAAVPRFLEAIEAAAWTEERRRMMTNLLAGLQVHPFRFSSDPLNKKALLLYLSEQRRLWHQAIPSPQGAWDIGIISQDNLTRARDQVYRGEHRKLDNERDYLVRPTPCLTISSC